MVCYFIWTAPHLKYVHPPGTIVDFSHLRVNPEFQQIFFQTPYVPDGCIYRATVLGREAHVPKVSFDTILRKKLFRKILKFFAALKMQMTSGFKIHFFVFTDSISKSV